MSDKKTPTQKIFMALLEESGLSATQFRKKTQISAGPYSRYTTGKNSISYNKVFELADSLGMEITLKISNK
ncbi:helix-turn-helix domain-containing protein [Tenacibaculum ovolyticum]|uniref:helix-turn-helix domain-containing protein n=1 Tax=Tenacibaculum ovolyticum TaxID=104270 RepID=UPI0007EC7706|nr:helix-turn-helix transcriptional regulator [Tenacibaculum ovolyticum]